MNGTFTAKVLLAVAVSGLLAGHAYAAKEEKAAKESNAGLAETETGYRRSINHMQRGTELIGLSVKDAQGKDAAIVEDVVLNKEYSGIEYAVLSFDRSMDVGNKYYAVPWKALQVQDDQGQKSLALKVDKGALRKAPGFERANWPDFSNEKWNRENYDAFGVKYEGRDFGNAQERSVAEGREWSREPSAETWPREYSDGGHGIAMTPGSPSMAALRDKFWSRRLSQIIGAQAIDEKGRNAGEIEDVVAEVSSGKMIYALVSVQGMEQKVAAVPWQATDFSSGRTNVAVAADRSTLQAVAFDEDRLPDFSNRDFARRNADRFGVEPYWETIGYVGEESGTRKPSKEKTRQPEEKKDNKEWWPW